jgi:RHS repeat-associated protein
MCQLVPLPNSDRLQTTTCKNSGSTVLTTTRSWDRGVRLSAILNQTNGGGVVTSHSYQYDSAGRRTRAALEDGSVWVYDYNDRDELTGARRYSADWSPVSGQFFGYDYDNIGNRKSAWSGGDVNGANLHQTTYTANALNQYTAISNPGYEQVLGVALATNTVTVNTTPADRKGEYFHGEMSVANGSGPCWTDTSVASGGASASGGIITPAGSQTLFYDADGNLTYDGLWTYEWDAENHLISMSMTNATSLPNAKRLRLDFAYDYRNRRVQKTVSTWNGSEFASPTTILFVYDLPLTDAGGWNLLAELDTSLSPLRTYTWGQDISGTIDQASGIGGLIFLTLAGSPSTNCFVAYDGNGDVTALVETTSGNCEARCEYSPFGAICRATGKLSKDCSFRFSTKFSDYESGLVNYGFRSYSPALARWLSRDPAVENGGIGLYAFVSNSPLLLFDADGQWPTSLAGWVRLGNDATKGNWGLALAGVPVTAPITVALILRIDLQMNGTLLHNLPGGIAAGVSRLPLPPGSPRSPAIGMSQPWATAALTARLSAVSAVGAAAGNILAGTIPSNPLSTAGLAISFVQDSRRGSSEFAELDAVLLGLSIGLDRVNNASTTLRGGIGLTRALLTQNGAAIASYLPDYTALNAWDMLSDISPALDGL